MDQNDFGIVRALYQRAQEQPGPREVRLPQETAKVYLSTARRIHDQRIYARLVTALSHGLDQFSLACEAVFNEIAQPQEALHPPQGEAPPHGEEGHAHH